MLRYIVHRVLLAIPTLVGVAALVFLMLRVMPGDIVELKLMSEGADVSPATLAAERARLGLDKPLYLQFVDWVAGLLTGDLGLSMWTGKPVAHEIAIRAELSLEVALIATAFATALALPLGTFAALFKDSWVDYGVRIFSIAGLAVPSFWLGMLIILGLLTTFQWMPPIVFTPIYEDPARNLAQLVWPALSVGYRYSAVVTRMTRSTLLEVLQEDYIRTARAKGLLERVVMTRHALRNALLPVITVVGLEFAFLIGGLVVTEQVFNLNGLGKLMVETVTRGDYTMVQALVMLFASVYIVINLVVDLLYAALDPRIRYA